MIGVAGLLLPRAMRVEWATEWMAELSYIRVHHPGRAFGFSLGAFADALWVRRNCPIQEPWLDSPARCLGLLAVLAGVCVLFALPRLTGVEAAATLRAFPANLLCIGIALLIVPSSTPLSLGDYSAGHTRRVRWGFFAAKILFVLAIVVFGTTALVGTPLDKLRAHAIVPGSMIAFRWLIEDQRRRCPECLRLLRHPAAIGSASHTFLEWYGTELACPRGHGLLHVSEIGSVSCYQPQRWMPLDASWRGLFTKGRRSTAQGPA